MEKYKKIIGYPDYEINKNGEIISYKRIKPKKIKPYVAGNGYWEITLSPEKGIYKRLSVHRLLAQHFIPNSKNLPQINHKDGNTLNYQLNNLEWITASDNTLHYIYSDKGKFKRKIIIVDNREFPSLRRCAEYFGMNKKNLSSQLMKGIIPKKLRGKIISYK